MDETLIKITTALIDLSAEKPMSQISDSELAGHAGITEDDLAGLFKSRMAIIDAIITQTIIPPIENFEADAEESVKESLFDVMMEMFEAIQEKRAFILNVEGYLKCRLNLICERKRDAHAIFQKMLEVCGVRNRGIEGHVKAKILQAAFWGTYRVWRNDDSQDMAATMAELDRILGKLEALAMRQQRSPMRAGMKPNER